MNLSMFGHISQISLVLMFKLDWSGATSAWRGLVAGNTMLAPSLASRRQRKHYRLDTGKLNQEVFRLKLAGVKCCCQTESLTNAYKFQIAYKANSMDTVWITVYFVSFYVSTWRMIWIWSCCSLSTSAYFSSSWLKLLMWLWGGLAANRVKSNISETEDWRYLSWEHVRHTLFSAFHTTRILTETVGGYIQFVCFFV